MSLYYISLYSRVLKWCDEIGKVLITQLYIAISADERTLNESQEGNNLYMKIMYCYNEKKLMQKKNPGKKSIPREQSNQTKEMKIAVLVLLSLFMRDIRKCNISHAPSTDFSGWSRRTRKNITTLR